MRFNASLILGLILSARSAVAIGVQTSRERILVMRQELCRLSLETQGAASALRAIAPWADPVRVRAEMLVHLTRDPLLADVCSASACGELADRILSEEDAHRTILHLISRAIERTPKVHQKMLAKQRWRRESRAELREIMMANVRRYLAIEWAPFDQDFHDRAAQFIESAVYADPKFQADPESFLLRLKRRAGPPSSVPRPEGVALLFLEYQREHGWLIDDAKAARIAAFN